MGAEPGDGGGGDGARHGGVGVPVGQHVPVPHHVAQDGTVAVIGRVPGQGH